MIADNLDKICCEDISLIENYESAISDKTEMWDCHHRLETHDENGNINKRSTECPGDGWYLGRSGDFKNKISTTKKSQHIITKGSKGLHWYNNGIVEISSKTCPKGFVPGRLKKN